MLGACGMEFQIAFLMVGLLEQDIGSDPCFFQLPVVLHCGGGNVYIYPANGAVFMFNAVDSLNTFQYIFNRIIHRILSCLQGQSLMSHILKGDNFPADFLLGQFFPWDMFVLGMIWTVDTAVDTVVGKIQRRKKHDPVSVEILFDLFCQSIDLLVLILQITVQKDRRLSVAQSLSQPGLIQDLIDQFSVMLILLCIFKGLHDLLMVDKIICAF